MSKFAAALSARNPQIAAAEPPLSTHPVHALNVEPINETQRFEVRRKVGRPAGKRSDDANTQVTGYVPAQLYYDVRIKLIERKMRDRKAKTDFSDLLREWMERWLGEQA